MRTGMSMPGVCHRCHSLQTPRLVCLGPRLSPRVVVALRRCLLTYLLMVFLCFNRVGGEILTIRDTPNTQGLSLWYGVSSFQHSGVHAKGCVYAPAVYTEYTPTARVNAPTRVYAPTAASIRTRRCVYAGTGDERHGTWTQRPAPPPHQQRNEKRG